MTTTTDDRTRPAPPDSVELIAQACRRIETSDAEPSLRELAGGLNLSPGHFHRLFKRIMGLTPKDYAAAHRAARVRENLRSGASVTQAMHDAGFNSSGRFYEQSSAMLGMTPRSYRAGGINEQLHFAAGATSLGAIVVASSNKGIAAILLGEDPDLLVRDLQDRFPRAQLIGADADYETLVARVVGLVEQPGLDPGLPLDVRGTAFQHRVWQALREIPAGHTATYTEIARQIGSPAAHRAVAAACAANHLAVAIPCHRVVRTDGALAGYAWGVERKSALLRREAEQGLEHER